MKPDKPKFASLFYNGMTYFGVVLAAVVFVAEVFLFILDFSDHGENLYLGIITYTILPVFLIAGLLLIAIGALIRRRRLIKGIDKPFSFVLDLSRPQHRNGLLVFIVGTTILLVMTGIGVYKAYHYTESVQFCGTMCHQVMEPEHTAYLNSPHARVKCVECHIGAGAGWYVKAKVSGSRQVFKVLSNAYARPVATPVHDLRPSKDTCEQCHWPEKFYSQVELNKMYYATQGQEIPEWSIRMMMHVGRQGEKASGQGIHAHMYLDQDFYYAADDEQRQKISWVKTVDKSGKEKVFVTPDSPYARTPPAPEKIRKMDCIDCHNRPTHIFHAPYELLNNAMSRGDIDETLPGIKEKAMKLMSGKYASSDEAGQKIQETLTAQYQKTFGADYPSREKDVQKSVTEVVKLFRQNFFPVMKTRWDTHPNNIGHLVSQGCFRCHDGQHAAAGGDVISRDCKICHTIIEQGPPDNLQKNADGLDFQHPFEDDGSWQEMNCADCHTGN